MRLTRRISDECIELRLADGKKKTYWDRQNRLTFPAVEKLADYEDKEEAENNETGA